MSIASRYRHTVTVKRMTATGATDDYGQPVTTEETVATVPGLVQPRSAREVALASQAGAVIGSHVLYIDPLAALGSDCWVEVAGERFDVVSVADAGGVGHHYEVSLRSVA